VQSLPKYSQLLKADAAQGGEAYMISY